MGMQRRLNSRTGCNAGEPSSTHVHADLATTGPANGSLTPHGMPARMPHLEIDMNLTSFMRGTTVALALASCAGLALANGDIYSRLFEMRQMDRDKDGMVSKQEFLDMVAKAWDMKAAEMKVKGRMSPEQLRELEKTLGRSIGAPSGT